MDKCGKKSPMTGRKCVREKGHPKIVAHYTESRMSDDRYHYEEWHESYDDFPLTVREQVQREKKENGTWKKDRSD